MSVCDLRFSVWSLVKIVQFSTLNVSMFPSSSIDMFSGLHMCQFGLYDYLIILKLKLFILINRTANVPNCQYGNLFNLCSGVEGSKLSFT